MTQDQLFKLNNMIIKNKKLILNIYMKLKSNSNNEEYF